MALNLRFLPVALSLLLPLTTGNFLLSEMLLNSNNFHSSNNRPSSTFNLFSSLNGNQDTTNRITTAAPPVNDVKNIYPNNLNTRCVQKSSRDFRPHPEDCTQFTMCSSGSLIAFSCPHGSVFHELSGSCVLKGSYFDTCSHRQASQLICPPGATYKKAHPHHCARYYHCGAPAQERHWEDHLKECSYPMLFNEENKRCEHYSMVVCGARKEPLDPCEYRSNTCDGHVHCVPCTIRKPSCRDHGDGMNPWKGRERSPYYVVCSNQRVVYSGMCTQQYGPQTFDVMLGVCRPI